MHPAHDTIANFRQQFLAEIKDLFVQVLLLAQAAGVLKLGHLSLDGSKIHAAASQSQAVSYKRLLELEARAEQRYQEELAEYQAKLKERAEKAQARGRKGGRSHSRQLQGRARKTSITLPTLSHRS